MRKTYSIKIRDREFILGRRTWIMGVLNVTPDSFSDGGTFLDRKKAVEHGLEMISQGADIVDIGGESSRPGARPIPEAVEMERVVPVVGGLRHETGALLSVDTTKSSVAKAALDAGADMVNDISALRFDPEMAGLAARYGAPVILMHMRGTPETMQKSPFYEDLFGEIRLFLKTRIEVAQYCGIDRDRIIVDPGIGFGKGFEDNLRLINNLDFLSGLGCPICIGVSRKSFLGNILGLPPAERLEGTIAAGVISIVRGAHILRVHDVREGRRAADSADAILAAPGDAPAADEMRT
jgi:dihydropteroate synthase